MSDPRLNPDPALATQNRPAQVAVPVADLCCRPDGPRDRQLLFGEQVTVLHEASGWAYVKAEKDGYCGHVLQSTLGTLQGHASRLRACHPCLSRRRSEIAGPAEPQLRCARHSHGRDQGFRRNPAGAHSAGPSCTRREPRGRPGADRGAVHWHALSLGRQQPWGIDCSGLVQAALLACGIPCPGDSDQQEKTVGAPVSDAYQRNDLLFWKGHVALVVDGETMIHANAHAMAVSYENIAEAIARIEAGGDGPVAAHRRPGL